MKRPLQISRTCTEIFANFMMILLSFLGSTVIVSLHFYVHEFLGHVLTGYVTNALLGRIPTFHIGNWPKIFFIPVPQNTTFDTIYGGAPINIIVALAGPTAMIIFSVVIALLIYKSAKECLIPKKAFVILLVLFIISVSATTIIGDVLFGGTDDWREGNTPIFQYKDHPIANQYIILSAGIQIILMTIILYCGFLRNVYKTCKIS